MIEFGKANHIAAAATAVTVEQILVGIDEKAWLMIVVQRAEPHPSAAAEPPNRSPIVGLQVVQQGNPPFEFIYGLSTQGLLASKGRIRRMVAQSQARMVGGEGALQPIASQNFAASKVPRCSKRVAHRRTVEASGDRDGSATPGTDRSQLLSAWRSKSQACRRQWRL